MNYQVPYSYSSVEWGSASLYAAKNIIIEGLEFVQHQDNNSSGGLFVNSCKEVIFRNLYIHDVTDDSLGSLTSCLSLNFSGPLEVRSNIMHDCYKTVYRSSHGNIREIMMTSLLTGKTRINYNTVFIGKDSPIQEGDVGVPTLIGTKHGSLSFNVELEIAYNQ